jgi:plasmid stabilization system protein ParE
MEMKVIWAEFARTQLENIFDYYKEKVNSETSRRIVERLIDRTIQLETFPESGPLEPLLKGRKLKYRYLVEGNYKIIYRIENLCICR